ncbi:MAG: response regulator transcription factor [Deltaproteobacteria bacterium]|jgi:two-component system phosphate regulon response regulator PhoB|nr:response regulator transcription factor [Deltaproteobacteria bacterium]
MSNTHTILIVEDDADIRNLLSFNLKREGFKVLEAAAGDVVLPLVSDKKPDLILLDLMLPGMDGLGVCRVLQRDARTADIPVIMLTAKGEEMDRVVGLELGAEDYIVKPFNVREVVLRIRTVLRRGVPTANKPAQLRCGEVCLDASSHSVTVAGRPAELTVTEFRLLEDLLQHQGQVRSREQLLDTVWGYSFEGYARTVDTHVRRLRAKLGQAADLVETVRGIGYRAKSG